MAFEFETFGAPLVQGEAAVKKPEGLSFQGVLNTATKVSKGLGFGGVVETLGTNLANIGVGLDPRTSLEEKVAISKELPQTTLAESIGAGVQLGANVAGFKGVGGIGSFAKRLLTNIGLGGSIFGGATAAEGGSAEEIAKSTAAGGAIGAAIPLAGATLRIIGDQIDNLPSRFIESALGRNKKVVIEEIRKGGEGLNKYLLEKKSIGTAETLLRNADDSVETLGKQIQEKLASAITQGGKVVAIGRDNFLDDVVKIPEAEGALLDRAGVRAIIERLAPQSKQILQKNSWTLSEANKLRQLLDRTLGDRGFLSSQLSSDKQVLLSFANNLRETVKSKAPEGVRALFSELANEIKLREALLNKVAQRAGNQVLSFGDFIGGGLGGIFGSLGAQPLLGAGLGVATRRAIESVPFKMGAAKVINAITKAGPVLEQLAPAQQTVILDLLSEILSPDAESNRQEGQSQ